MQAHPIDFNIDKQVFSSNWPWPWAVWHYLKTINGLKLKEKLINKSKTIQRYKGKTKNPTIPKQQKKEVLLKLLILT